MTYPILILVLHLLVLIYQRTAQMRNQASMSMTRLYSDYEAANKLINRRNLFVNVGMGASLLGGIGFYIVTFSADARQAFLTGDFAVSIAEATPLGDTTYVLMVLMVLVLGILSAIVARQLSFQSKEATAILEANFLEERANIDHILMIQTRLDEIGEDVQRLVATENQRLREEAMGQIR